MFITERDSDGSLCYKAWSRPTGACASGSHADFNPSPSEIRRVVNRRYARSSIGGETPGRADAGDPAVAGVLLVTPIPVQVLLRWGVAERGAGPMPMASLRRGSGLGRRRAPIPVILISRYRVPGALRYALPNYPRYFAEIAHTITL
jgi:hypothetical protein